jgi:hypothetical protein
VIVSHWPVAFPLETLDESVGGRRAHPANQQRNGPAKLGRSHFERFARQSDTTIR